MRTLQRFQATTTVTTIKVTNDYGSGLTDSAVTGLATADFSAFNDTTVLAVVVTVAETVDGTYTLTYVAQTALDLVTFKILPVSGFEGKIQVII